MHSYIHDVEQWAFWLRRWRVVTLVLQTNYKYVFVVIVTCYEDTPLHDLIDDAPALPDDFTLSGVVHPFSNDDSIASFEAAQSRFEAIAHQETRHRVALLVGESALSTNVHMLPESTIVLVDKDPNMVRYMRDYVRYVRMAETPELWAEYMGITQHSFLDTKTVARFAAGLDDQMTWWLEVKGLPHAFNGGAMYRHSRKEFQEKAIVPWQANITNETDMQHLANALRKRDAAVTILNLTNVIPTNATFPTTAGFADVLDALPTTPGAPIITSSRFEVATRVLDKTPASPLLEATGPFYGLEQLRDKGGNSTSGPVALPPERLLQYTREKQQLNDLLGGWYESDDLDGFAI